MLINLNFKTPIFFTIAFILAILFSCKKTYTDIGTNLQNQNDLTLHYNVLSDIAASVNLDDSVATDERSKILLGSYIDDIFGFSQASIAMQFRLSSYDVNFGTNPVVDSIVLYMDYTGFYGDTSTQQEISVFQLNQSIFKDSSYYSNRNISQMANSSSIANINTSFSPNSNSTLHIPLNNSFGMSLIADSGYYANNDTFLLQYQGLYITTTPVSSNGAIIYFDPVSENTKITLYYHNDSQDTLSFDFLINENCAYFNQFVHDYSGSTFYNNINTDSSLDNLFIQSMGGVKAKISLNDLISWKDSGKIAINKAELVLRINDLNNDMQLFPQPERLLLEIVDNNDGFDGPIDYYMESDYFNGYYGEQSMTYVFNITGHVQRIINGEETNTELYIFPESNKISSERIVIANSDTNKIKLNITYSKFK